MICRLDKSKFATPVKRVLCQSAEGRENSIRHSSHFLFHRLGCMFAHKRNMPPGYAPTHVFYACLEDRKISLWKMLSKKPCALQRPCRLRQPAPRQRRKAPGCDASHIHTCLLACRKSSIFITRMLTRRPRLIIGSDTVVVLGDKILEKPGSKAEAVDMLKSLSGQKHTVVTGVALVIQHAKGGTS